MDLSKAFETRSSTANSKIISLYIYIYALYIYTYKFSENSITLMNSNNSKKSNVNNSLCSWEEILREVLQDQF